MRNKRRENVTERGEGQRRKQVNKRVRIENKQKIKESE